MVNQRQGAPRSNSLYFKSKKNRGHRLWVASKKSLDENKKALKFS